MAMLIKQNGDAKEIAPQNGKSFKLEELQKLVGGYIEHVHVGLAIMVVDEEGKLREKKLNQKATRLAFPNGGDVIVGDVVICSKKEAGYND